MTRAPKSIQLYTLAEVEAMDGDVFVRKAREALGLSVAQLADLLGVVPQTIWRWERDPMRHPDSARTVDSVARRLLFWMLRPGNDRPSDWPKVADPKKGGAA